MKIFRKFFYNFFGLKSYLRFISIVYIRLVRANFFRKKYPELFFLKEIVKKNDVCIDIGANLGYYTTFLSKLVGKNGKVFAVEPVPLFREILQRNIKKTKSDNTEIMPYALGGKEGRIKMGMPEKDGIIHHGMTKVTDADSNEFVEYFEAEMKIPDILFAEIPKIDFIKCDVEGYEQHVFSNMLGIIKSHKPVVQSELSGKDNRLAVYNIFRSLNYTCYQLENGELVEKDQLNLFEKDSDFYFMPKKS